jgi:ubiquinone/menaquinone biosynthesis C-methylase UbiE
MTTPDALFTDGAAYERLMGRWSRLVGETFIDWLDVPPGLRWLDVGCGNGAFTELVIERRAPAAAVAVDPSDEQLAYARSRPGARTAQFHQGDAQALRFTDGAFDIAAMALVISFLPDPARAIAEMTRVVRPGGVVATYMWDFDGRGVPVTPIYEALQALGTPTPLPNTVAARRDVMQDLFEKAGLEAVETRVIRIPTVFANFDDFWDSNAVPVGPQGKHIAGMSSAERDRLRAHLRERVPVAPDGRIVYESVANAAKGRVPASTR